MATHLQERHSILWQVRERGPGVYAGAREFPEAFTANPGVDLSRNHTIRAGAVIPERPRAAELNRAQ
jgi:hypothetical protein